MITESNDQRIERSREFDVLARILDRAADETAKRNLKVNAAGHLGSNERARSIPVPSDKRWTTCQGCGELVLQDEGHATSVSSKMMKYHENGNRMASVRITCDRAKGRR